MPAAGAEVGEDLRGVGADAVADAEEGDGAVVDGEKDGGLAAGEDFILGAGEWVGCRGGRVGCLGKGEGAGADADVVALDGAFAASAEDFADIGGGG